MEIGGFQKFSLIDFPGHLSAIVFTQGCNMRCGYCHNPELVIPEKFLKKINQSEVISFLKKRINQLDGLVVTGGEPTIQFDLIDFLKQVKELGYSIKLDTNGSRPDVLVKLINQHLVDYFAMDIKGPQSLYESITNVSIDFSLIQESIKVIRQSGCLHEFRTTVVADQLRQEDIMEIGKMIQGADHYFLQRFNASGKLLDERFAHRKSYDQVELEKWASLLEQKYVTHCSIR
jgi:pyruvate formate lyase activating enzyme